MFSEGQAVYVRSAEHGWELGEVKGYDGPTHIGVHTAQRKGIFTVKDVSARSVLAAKGVDDMFQLELLSIGSLLHNLRTRHAKDEYYTAVSFVYATRDINFGSTTNSHKRNSSSLKSARASIRVY
jgi:myosin heavy subunit